MRITHRLVPGLVAGALLVGGASGAFAAKIHAKVHRAFAFGQVSGYTPGAALTLTSAAKKAGATAPAAVTVTLTSTTKEKARKGTTGTLANGDYAVVIGQKTSTGITAKRILFSSTTFKGKTAIKKLKQRLAKRHTAARRHTVRGTVNGTQSTATTLVLTTKNGKSRSFAITAATKYRVDGTLATAAPALTNGETVGVRFKRDKAAKTFDAVVVAVKTAAQT